MRRVVPEQRQDAASEHQQPLRIGQADMMLDDPKRLLVLGTRILPLLGHDPAQAAPAMSELAIQDRRLPVLATFAPERLLANARQRAALWQRWLDWTDGESD